MNIKEMIARQRALLDLAKGENRDLTADEQREFDELTAKIEEATRSSGEAHEPTADEVRTAERERVAEITSLCRDFDLDATNYINDGSTVEQVRAAIIEEQRRAHAPVNAHSVTVEDEKDRFRAAAADAMILRSGLSLENPAAGANELRGLSVAEMLRESLRHDGVSEQKLRYADPNTLFDLSRQFYSPTATFPSILDNTIEKAFKEAYTHVPVTFDRFTKKGSLSDFKTHDNYYLAGPAGEFLLVPEGGELKHDTYKEDKLPTRKLKTYGRQFTMTREAVINDDIGVVTQLPAKYAASARKTINKQVYQILVGNPAIFDGTNLFSAAHKNLLATGTGVTQAAVQGMITHMGGQRDQFGEAITIRPATLVVPVGMEFDMYTLFNSPYIETANNTQAVNPLYGRQFEIVADPTLNALVGEGNAMPWFMIGDTADCDFIEVDYLNGQEMPNIRRMETPGQLGFVWDIYLDWGISVMDYRGVIKNPGIVLNPGVALASN